MYLPLANLTDFQKRMLDPATSAAAVKGVNAGLLAYESGVEAIPATIQYLNERKQMEVSSLQTLSRSTIPATIMWGAHDMVAPVRVADYVFTTAIESRAVAGAYWLMPCGNHYVQHDQPADLAKVIRFTLAQQAAGKPLPAAPYNLATDACGPVLVRREGR